MKIKKGKGTTQYGTGVLVELSRDEVATAIDAYLVAHNIIVCGPRTITMNGEWLKKTEIYVDPSGKVIAKGIGYSGRTGEKE